MSDDFFDEDHAARREQMFAKLEPLSSALYLVTQAVLLDLPPGARILCVGAGTGPELFSLARAFPSWSFVAVDPSAPMLERLRARAEREGIAERCEIHEGYLDSLPAQEPFDAATCFLVSHFLTELDERRALFVEIAGRLRPGGLLVSAELTGDAEPARHERRLESWARLFRVAEIPAPERETMLGALGVAVATLPAEEFEALLRSAGFAEPLRVFQSLLIHAWSAQKPASA